MKSALIINGNDPKFLLDATLYGADAVIFDLDEAVPGTDKDAARVLLQEAFQFFDYSSIQIIVRPNLPGFADFEPDLVTVGKSQPAAFIVPAATPDFVQLADAILKEVEKENGFDKGSIGLIPSVDTVLGLEKIGETIAASPRVQAVVFNADRYLEDLGVTTQGGAGSLLYARGKIAVACRIAGVPAIDTAFAGEADALEADVKEAKASGFAGKVAANGNQVAVINAVFA
jgi:citrate lyase subunit beta/citryl-CoA lyase